VEGGGGSESGPEDTYYCHHDQSGEKAEAWGEDSRDNNSL